MSRAVWKYDIPTYTAATSVGYYATIPVGARFLHVAVQHRQETITAWFEVDIGAQEETRHFRVFGTGHTIEQPELNYLGTTLHEHGHLVLHLYEDAS